MSSDLEVWLDSDLVSSMTRVGTLSNDRGTVRFVYDSAWLDHPLSFMIDPSLTLDKSPFFPRPEQGNFGIFLDSSPDRWGQTLMKRREALEAKDAGRKPRNLYAWDFLVGVQDVTRQGALRFRLAGSTDFVSNHPMAAPPVTSLRELSEVAHALSSKHINDLVALKRWLSVLVAPGSSLGGARPKANFLETDKTSWIAKFPAMDDDLDVGAWEGLTHALALNAGVNMPPAKTIKFGADHRTFCVRRFDRSPAGRVFYASAMTMLQADQSEGASYLDIAQFLQISGSPEHQGSDLAQLFRRVAFNIAIGNRDDHLRNHGFLMTKDGWRLAPAFDVNPNPHKATHVLNIDESDNRPNLQSLFDSAPWYGLSDSQAAQIIDEVLEAVSGWRAVASRMQIPNAEIETMESVILAFDDGPSLTEAAVRPRSSRFGL